MDATSTMATEESCPETSIKGRTSKYFGVNKPKGQEGVYVAYVYDKEKAHSVHLGTFGDEEEAARAHDVATFKCSGHKAKYNFPMSEYEETLKLMKNLTKQQVVAAIRRSSSRFARAVDSNYRGVVRTQGTGRWMAYKGVKNAGIFLGSFVTQEEAAMAYDVETIKAKGWNALTNFDIKLYNVEAILAASANPSVEEDRAKFIKKELLDMPQKYTEGMGKLFLEQLVDRLRGETTGTGETSNSIWPHLANSGDNQLPKPANAEEHDMQNKMSVEQNPVEPPPYHFATGAGCKFRHSSSSCFKPYKRAKPV